MVVLEVMMEEDLIKVYDGMTQDQEVMMVEDDTMVGELMEALNWGVRQKVVGDKKEEPPKLEEDYWLEVGLYTKLLVQRQRYQESGVHKKEEVDH
jgi:hypothetical protein